MTNPTPTDWRALCAELHAAVQLYTGQNPSAAETPPNELVSRLMGAMAATATALAQPEPQGPTDEELDEFAVFWWGSDTDERTVTDVIECCSMTAYARAVLARWGTCGFGRNVRIYMEPIDD